MVERAAPACHKGSTVKIYIFKNCSTEQTGVGFKENLLSVFQCFFFFLFLLWLVKKKALE